MSISPVNSIEMQPQRPLIDLSKQPVSLPGRKNSLERVRKQCWERDELKTHEAQKLAEERAKKLRLFGLIVGAIVFFPVTLFVFSAMGVYELICHLKEKYKERRELHALLCESLPDGALEVPREENMPTSDPYDFETPGETPQSKALLGFEVEEEAFPEEEEDESECESLFDSSEATPEDPSEVLLGFGLEEEAFQEEEDDLDNESLFGLSGPTPEEATGGEDLVLDGAPELPVFEGQGEELLFGEESDCEEEFEIHQPGMAKIDLDFAKFLKNEITSEAFFQKRLLKESELSALAEKIDKKEFRKNPEDKRFLEIVEAFEVDREERDMKPLMMLYIKKDNQLELLKNNQLKNEIQLLKNLIKQL
jgi:hypothetical protein